MRRKKGEEEEEEEKRRRRKKKRKKKREGGREEEEEGKGRRKNKGKGEGGEGGGGEGGGGGRRRKKDRSARKNISKSLRPMEQFVPLEGNPKTQMSQDSESSPSSIYEDSIVQESMASTYQSDQEEYFNVDDLILKLTCCVEGCSKIQPAAYRLCCSGKIFHIFCKEHFDAYQGDHVQGDQDGLERGEQISLNCCTKCVDAELQLLDLKEYNMIRMCELFLIERKVIDKKGNLLPGCSSGY
ncbi:hypothetical protein WDU94_006426 [Cyamophila willieti]